MRSLIPVLATCAVANAQWHRYSPRRGDADPPAQETKALHVAPDNWGVTPRPTQPPGRSAAEAVLELFKRDTQNTWIDDVTCGWFSESSSSAFMCPPTASCATNTDHVVACVSGASQPFYTACLDYNAFKQGACSGMGISTGCCQTSSFGACGTFIWTGQPARSMYRCFESQRIISMLDVPREVLDSSTSTRATTSSTSGAVVTETNSSGGSADNTGAIVGGAVGGVAVIALIGLGAAFLIIRRKKQRYAPLGDAAGHQPPSTGRPPSIASMAQSGAPYIGATGYNSQLPSPYHQQAYDPPGVSPQLYQTPPFSAGLGSPKSPDPPGVAAKLSTNRQSYMSVASVELDTLPAPGHKLNPVEIGTHR